MADTSLELQQKVIQAASRRQPLAIHGNHTKAFLGPSCQAEPLDVSQHQGILHYEPTELVITARAGTLLSEIENTLADNGQMLAFEPPSYHPQATLGGTIACNLSGPRRPYCGSARDYMLGCRIINGHGQIISFGGEVMKNVAGYDVSRLMTGAFGTLGILLDVSLKVLPRPPTEWTFKQNIDTNRAIQKLTLWRRLPLPISAICHDAEFLYYRLSGTERSLSQAHNSMGGEQVEDSNHFWERIKEHRHAFFDTQLPLWRLSVPPTAKLATLTGKSLLEWGGAQRWLITEMDPEKLRQRVSDEGGHASLYRGLPEMKERLHPMDTRLKALNERIKHAFDPDSLLNPGRMHPSF